MSWNFRQISSGYRILHSIVLFKRSSMQFTHHGSYAILFWVNSFSVRVCITSFIDFLLVGCIFTASDFDWLSKIWRQVQFVMRINRIKDPYWGTEPLPSTYLAEPHFCMCSKSDFPSWIQFELIISLQESLSNRFPSYLFVCQGFYGCSNRSQFRDVNLIY